MLVIFSKVLVVFIYVGIGFAANRLKVLPGECVKYFTALIMNITVPCLMISAITGQELDAGMYRNTIILFVLTSLIYVIIAVLSSLFADHFFTDRDQQDRNILASAMTGCNSGFMGFPVAKAVYGAKVFFCSDTEYLQQPVLVSDEHPAPASQGGDGKEKEKREGDHRAFC